MKLNIQNITITDIIALLVVVGGFYLLSKGVDGTVSICLTLVVGFYFGHKIKSCVQ